MGAAISLLKCSALIGRDLSISSYSFSSSPYANSSSSSFKRRAVTWRRTVEKWIKENDSQLSTFVWLKFSMVDREHIAVLNCSICSQFCTKQESMRNFKPAFIDGSSNIRISAVKDHAATDMHAYAVQLLKKQQSSSVLDYAPTAKCLAETSMDWSILEKNQEEV